MSVAEGTLERSELALDGVAGTVASRRERGARDHATETATRKHEHPVLRAIADGLRQIVTLPLSARRCRVLGRR